MPTNLAQKLAQVTEAVGRVPKNGRNKFHNYDYVTEADLVDAVRGELTKRQVALIPSAYEAVRDGSLTTLHMRFTFLDGESGETFESEWFGTGEDKGDKGLYKAYTGALKYFLMKTFLIATGDDPERDAGAVQASARPSRSNSAEGSAAKTPPPALPQTNPSESDRTDLGGPAGASTAMNTAQRITDLAAQANLSGLLRARLNGYKVSMVEELLPDKQSELLEWLRTRAGERAAA